MAFPNRIQRTVQLAHPPERVWAALTTAEGLGTWFGRGVEIDLRVGGQATLTWHSGDTAVLSIKRLQPPRVFGFTWPVNGLPDDDARRTYVEFTLEPTSNGTALTMVESGFAAGHLVRHDQRTGAARGRGPGSLPRQVRSRRLSHTAADSVNTPR